jgi:hypothetical protein
MMPAASFLLRTGSSLQTALTYRIAWGAFVPRPDDLYIAAYPKSGTTLLQMMVHQIRTDGRMDFPHINAVCPWIELEFHRNNAAGLEALESPRCFKTHLLYRQLPRSGRLLYIVRDVRDVAVSAWHHARLLGGVGNLEDFTVGFLRRGWGSSSTWFQHLRSWWPHRRDPRVLFLSYERVIADLEGTVRRVADFSGLPLREEEIPRIVERCGITFMKQHEEKFDSRFQGARPEVQGFIRRGEAREGRELSLDQRERIDRELSALAEELGRARGVPYLELLDEGDERI